MAPSIDDTVNDLKDVITKLETRLGELENRFFIPEKPKTLSERLRIILMGPPGAGMCFEVAQSEKGVNIWM